MTKNPGGTVGKAKGPDDEWLVVFDRGANTYYADLVTELSEHKGVVRMSFASVSTNGDGIPKATVVARLRMPKDLAWQLCRELKELEG